MVRCYFFILIIIIIIIIILTCDGKTSVANEINDDIELRRSGGENGEEDDDIVHDDIKLWGGGENWGEDAEDITSELEDEEAEMLESEGVGRIPVNVDSFGAVGDGVTDDTKAFMDAWDVACATRYAVFLVPEQKKYLVKALRFKGPCKHNLIVHIAGTIVAPDEPKDWDPKNPRTWLVFTGLEKAWFQGGGTIDGSGSKWWASSCKINKTNPCRWAPTALTIDLSTTVRVKDLSIQNSQQMHFTIARSTGVRIFNVRVHAPSDSPNTDGIHITRSTNVILEDAQIGTGDDCISIVNATANIRMKNIECGPGHGISIGSLGKDNKTAVVRGIVLDTARITGASNGLRIKTWQGGSGYVRSIRYQNVQMVDVKNPIIIDQFYCDSSNPCKNQTSAVKVSQVIYRNIKGTSRTAKAINFKCSNNAPCRSIVLNNIDLRREKGEVETFCNCAMGFAYGFTHPSANCLRSDISKCTGEQPANLTEPYTIVHTEL